MRILVSGLNEHACGEFTGGSGAGGHAFSWCAPAEFANRLAKPTGSVEADRAVWLYRAPWSPTAISEAAETGRPPNEILEAWARDNRTVLNARAQAGIELLLINADRASPAELKAELDRPGSVRSTSDDVASTRPSSQALAKLFDLAAPQCWDVFEALEAAAWTSGDIPLFSGKYDPDEASLHALLRSLYDSQSLPKVRGELAEVRKELDAVRADLDREKTTHNETRQESELLLIQLHQVQEELEQYYLKSLYSEKALEENRRKADLTQQEIKALKLKLGQMQSELKLAQVPSVSPVTVNGTGTPSLVRRLRSRIVPPPLRRAVLRNLSQRLQKSQRLQLAQSGLFNAQWYLDTYPDVREAKADPILHYLTIGWKENRNPGPDFDTAYYLQTHPDVRSSGINPLWHYLEFGSKEGRRPRKP